MKYLIAQYEIAYVTRYDGEEIVEVWEAPKNKWFQPLVMDIEGMKSEEAFKENVKIIDKIFK